MASPSPAEAVNARIYQAGFMFKRWVEQTFLAYLGALLIVFVLVALLPKSAFADDSGNDYLWFGIAGWAITFATRRVTTVRSGFP